MLKLKKKKTERGFRGNKFECGECGGLSNPKEKGILWFDWGRGGAENLLKNSPPLLPQEEENTKVVVTPYWVQCSLAPTTRPATSSIPSEVQNMCKRRVKTLERPGSPAKKKVSVIDS